MFIYSLVFKKNNINRVLLGCLYTDNFTLDLLHCTELICLQINRKETYVSLDIIKYLPALPHLYRYAVITYAGLTSNMNLSFCVNRLHTKLMQMSKFPPGGKMSDVCRMLGRICFNRTFHTAHILKKLKGKN